MGFVLHPPFEKAPSTPSVYPSNNFSSSTEAGILSHSLSATLRSLGTLELVHLWPIRVFSRKPGLVDWGWLGVLVDAW